MLLPAFISVVNGIFATMKRAIGKRIRTTRKTTASLSLVSHPSHFQKKPSVAVKGYYTLILPSRGKALSENLIENLAATRKGAIRDKLLL